MDFSLKNNALLLMIIKSVMLDRCSVFLLIFVFFILMFLFVFNQVYFCSVLLLSFYVQFALI